MGLIMKSKELSAPTQYPEVYEQLCDVVGEQWVSAHASDRIAYSYDVWPVGANRVHRGTPPCWPDMVVWPETAEQIRAIISLSNQFKVPVIPFSGGSGIVGGIVPIKPCITLDVKRLDQILALDRVSRTVTVGAGMMLQHLEDQLNQEGCTLGHFPQSMHSAAVGGTVAHNGIGTFSTRYGKFDDMVLGMQVVLPSADILDIRAVPKRSTGPKLNELFLGSEGTMGVVTEVTLKIHEMPQKRLFQSFAVPDMRVGLDLCRRVVQHDLRPAVVRLYDEVEGKGLLFESINIKNDQCLLVFIYEGYEEIVDFESKLSFEICAQNGGTDLGPDPSKFWYEHKRFDVRHYLAKTVEPSRIADTLEIAGKWDTLADLYYEVRQAMEKYPCRSMGHTSHIYQNGANLYMIFFAQAESEDAQVVEKLYFDILQATFETCARFGATISHHHGIGLAKGQWMAQEHGQAGLQLLQSIKDALDPNNILNPGKLGLKE